MRDHHLELLKAGVEAWNEWRSEHPGLTPRLRGADLRQVNLRAVNLRDADLQRAHLQGAQLVHADLTSADLSNAHLSGADFTDAILDYADLSDAVVGNPKVHRRDFWAIDRDWSGDVEVTWAPLADPESLRDRWYLRHRMSDEELEAWRFHIAGTNSAQYKPANLRRASLKCAKLTRSLCDRVNFSQADLEGSDFADARLVGANLAQANLAGAKLYGTKLRRATVSRAQLRTARRKRPIRWADAQDDFFTGDIEVYTHDFHEFITESSHTSSREFCVTLIHGTFAHRADWVGEESPMARQLAAEARILDPPAVVHVYPYRWTGRNTFRARREAAEGLRTHLHELINKHPAATQCAVAHSHGGGVLLQALREAELARKMHRVICVSTPFIRVFTTPDEWRTSFAVGLKSALAFSIVGLALQFKELSGVPREPSTTSLAWTLLIEMLCLAAFALGSKMINALLKIWASRATAVIAGTGHPQLRLGQAILIRTSADEAGYVLGLGATLAWLIERLAVSLLVIVPVVLMRVFSPRKLAAAAVVLLSTCAALVLSAIFVLLSPASALTPGAYAVLAVAAIFALPYIVIVALVLLLSLCYLSFGRDLAVCTPFLRATAEVAPSGIWNIFQFPSLTALPLSRLQHSFIYEYSTLRHFMARWLTTGEYISMRSWREM